MKEYDLFIRLCYNDGAPIEARKLQAIQDRLLAYFDGLMYFSQPNEGFWTMGGVKYRDHIVVYCVLCAKRGAS